MESAINSRIVSKRILNKLQIYCRVMTYRDTTTFKVFSHCSENAALPVQLYTVCEEFPANNSKLTLANTEATVQSTI